MPDDRYTCQSCRRATVQASFVEVLSPSSTLWTVPSRCVDCGGPAPVARPYVAGELVTIERHEQDYDRTPLRARFLRDVSADVGPLLSGSWAMVDSGDRGRELVPFNRLRHA